MLCVYVSAEDCSLDVIEETIFNDSLELDAVDSLLGSEGGTQQDQQQLDWNDPMLANSLLLGNYPEPLSPGLTDYAKLGQSADSLSGFSDIWGMDGLSPAVGHWAVDSEALFSGLSPSVIVDQLMLSVGQ